MSLDSITEQIAHFFGAFELTSEQARLREQYEEFVALRRKAELEDLEDPTRINIKADLKLDPGEYKAVGYKADLQKSDGALPNSQPAQISDSSTNPVAVTGSVETPSEGPELGAPSIQMNFIQMQPEVVTELIGSAVTYTFQSIHLSDNDTIGQGNFRDVETLMGQGDAMLNTALSLHAVSNPSIAIEDYLSGEAVEDLIEQMLSPQNTDVEGATVHQFHGEDAMGVIVNGEIVDEAPDWNDLLPAHHQTDEEPDDGTPDLLPAEWDQSEDHEFEDGHSVTTGGNLAINEVNVNVGWVDAPNIVVGGQSVNLTVISQVAVVSDTDEGSSGAQSDTHVVQSSRIEVEANEAAWLDDNVADPGEETIVVIDWIPGDLVVTNFVNQVIDATDIDHIQTEITASSTAYSMGENVMFNSADIVQLGTYYDVIIIGGDMVSVDAVTQTIVLLDDDVISGPETSDEDDNLVMNEVSLTATGVDTHEELSDNLADTTSMQEVDTDALEDALLNDPAFAGLEQVRVLKIDGDLLQVNIVDQVTIVRDQDDIHVPDTPAAEASALGAGNALLNTASVNKLGVDSIIMAHEEEYSDVLLHQASMFDIPEQDAGELASEAVAILMEELDGPGKSESAPGQMKLTPSEEAGVDDGLQSMIA